MDGIITLAPEQAGCCHHGGHGGGLHGNTGIIEALLFQQFQMLKGTFHQSFRSGMTVFFQQLFVQRTAVDADTDGDVFILAHIHHSLHPILAADIAGVDADLGGTAFGSGDGQLIIKMNIRNQGQRAFLADFSKATGSFHIGHCQACNLAAGRSQLADLLQRTFHIGGSGIKHGLDYHGSTAADGNSTHNDLSCHINQPLKRTKISLNIMIAISPRSSSIPAPWR